MSITPDKPQPFSPPVLAACVWEIPREGIPDLASSLYAMVTWGREPHPSQVSEGELGHWENVRPRWEAATESLLDMLEDVGHVVLTPKLDERSEQTQT